MAKNNKKDTNFAMAFLGVGMSVATEIAVATGLGYLLGNWIDQKMGWQPWGLMISVVLFLGGSMTHAIIVLKHLNNRMNSDD
ncbi:AtpZ/AtpI family protein [bacterium]|nr:AtpZ/AtpI family protein [bacterium]